jgi:signal peptidase I
VRSLVVAMGVALMNADCGSSRHTRTFEMPSSSMEPTIHCARPGAGCEANYADLVVTHETRDIKRGDIVVFVTPPPRSRRAARAASSSSA